MIDLRVLEGPRLKVQRAERHIDELIARSVPLDPALYSIRAESEERTIGFISGARTFTTTVWKYVPEQPVAEVFALIIGDVVHNLRSALDHLATGIIGAKAHFPITKDRGSLVFDGKPSNNPQNYLFTIEKALPGSMKLLLDKIRPENGADEHLWGFSTLDNDDKHNLILPTVTASVVKVPSMTTGPVVVANVSARNDATKPFELFSSNLPVTVEQDFQTSVDIRLAHVDVLKDEPAIPALMQIAGLVTNTINKFERLIRESA